MWHFYTNCPQCIIHRCSTVPLLYRHKLKGFSCASKESTGEGGESKGKPSLSTLRSLCSSAVLTQPCTEQKRRSKCMWNVCLFSMWRFTGFGEGRGGQLRREWEVLSIITHPPHCHSLPYAWNLCVFVGFGTIVCVCACGWLCILMLVVVFPQAWGIHVSSWKWQCCYGDSCIQFAAILFLLCFSQCVCVRVWGREDYFCVSGTAGL